LQLTFGYLGISSNRVARVDIVGHFLAYINIHY